mmetsp:Transcript_142191/g.454471  ORF Transcript_142191/g.454471 Transcript_142191/m.454471 type:complete len:208 (+) Transcript_142191:979-1602(+)
MRGIGILEPAISSGGHGAGVDLEADLLQERRLSFVAVAREHLTARVEAHFQVDALVLFPACCNLQNSLGDVPTPLPTHEVLHCSQKYLRAQQAHVLLHSQRLCDLLLQEGVLVKGLRVVRCHVLEPRVGHLLNSLADERGLVVGAKIDSAARRRQALPGIACEETPDLVLQVAAHLLDHPVALGDDLFDGQRPQIHVKARLDEEDRT